MELRIINRNIENSVSSLDYFFWRQMRDLKEKGWDDLIKLAIELNRDSLDSFEEEKENEI